MSSVAGVEISNTNRREGVRQKGLRWAAIKIYGKKRQKASLFQIRRKRKKDKTKKSPEKIPGPAMMEWVPVRGDIWIQLFKV